MSYEIRTLSLIVTPEGEDLFCEGATTVSVDDEAAGPFLVIAQEDQKLRVDFEEWPSICAAVAQLKQAWKVK